MVRRSLPLVAFTIVWLAPHCAFTQDTDGDGRPDDVEERLGTHKTVAEVLETIAAFPATVAEQPERDVVRVDFGSVAKDRWLWAIHFAKAYTFDNSTLIVYLDADNDSATGRSGMGCEVMLAHNRGAPGVTGFAPDGANASAPTPRVALVDGVLYLCHDGEIKQSEGRSAFRFTMLSETWRPRKGVDGTGWRSVTGPPGSDRRRPVMWDEITENERFERTEGLDLVWKLQGDPQNIAISSVGAELEGLVYYHSEYRWPAVIGANGSITITVPKAGRFIPAVVVYDRAGRQVYELSIDGQRAGAFVALEDDNRQRVYFLRQAVDFKGGEQLTFRVGRDTQHVTEDILLLAKRPPIRGRRFEISHVAAGCAKRDGEQEIRVTWTTTWPTKCTVEYGASTAYTEKLTEESAMANHRVYLRGHDPGAVVHYRVVATRPDGEAVVSENKTFTFAPPEPSRGTAEQERISLRVENPYDFALAAFPVSNGVPFSKGELGDPNNVRLLEAGGREVALQPKVSARWGDGSIKWLLVSFMASAEAKSTAEYALEYGTNVGRRPDVSPLTCGAAGNAISVDTGPLRVEFDTARSGFPTKLSFDANGDGIHDEGDSLSADDVMAATITDADGTSFTAASAAENIEVEEAGPVRVVVKTTGHHRTEDGGEYFHYVNRFVFYAGSPLVRLYTTWGHDWGGSEFARFTEFSLAVPLRTADGWHYTLGVGNGDTASGESGLALRQLRDDSFELARDGSSTAQQDGRADGWIDASNDDWGLTVAVRDFWQLYPKGLRATPKGLAVDLCPDFPDGTYDGCSKLDEIKLYFYLMNGEYKVRRGMQKQHEIMFCFHSGGFGDSARTAAQAFQEPPIAVCTPERYCDTLVFGEILPATAGRSQEYEEVCGKVYRNYVGHQNSTRGFGMLNFGDQFGERKVNWANGEYDHHHAFLMQFARTADRKWYFLGEKAARHAVDVDTCHYGAKRGGVWVHAMAHVGDYFTSPYEGGGIPRGGFTVSHTWTEGFYDWFALSGDPTGAENAALVADRYDGAYLNNYDYTNCRTNGWHLLLTMAAYRATGDPFYLNAAHIIIERTLERQAPTGGWPRQMVPGHCHCTPRCRGVANFMLGVLANGLEEYYREVPDPRVAEAIKGGAKQAIEELWVPEANGFRYTSCPEMKGYTANNDMTSEILFFAYRLGGDPVFGEVAMRAMGAAFDGGIGSIAHLRWTHHIIYNMDLLRREAGAINPKEDTTIRVRKENDRPFELWLGRTDGGTAPADSAEITTPSGETIRADGSGRFRASDGDGLYTLRLREGSGPWRLRTPESGCVIDAARPVTIRLGGLGYGLYFAPAPGAKEASVLVRPQQGSVRAVLKPAAGAPATGTATPEAAVRLACPVDGPLAEPWTLELRGSGDVEVALDGAAPYVALNRRHLFNPSTPVVVVEGLRSLALGGERCTLRARVSDAEDDVASITWQLDDGTTKEGEVLTHRFASAGTHRVSVTVVDEIGHRSTAWASISTPPPELASVAPERVVSVEAEDFVDQGLDKVRIFDRIGDRGKMLTYWHATIGHWLEWDVPITTAGDYAILLRYASGGTDPRRSLTLDGKSPGAPFDDMALAPTGGYCTSSDNWTFVSAGGGATVHLTEGVHKLRMANLGDGVALDYVAFVRREP